ncbi:UNKNOWN [Stylonychia lemnae]|uniref:Uncharacterized protein n=1 Tax=Stylonychia lemnae TaxID=5949 RepID=A0A078A5Q8_STYLE|nr:UNKNOWN [Stylonychia lemnae]|eukprot:CDW76099.1 UNKNOWN [Stylonychia lemnae]
MSKAVLINNMPQQNQVQHRNFVASSQNPNVMRLNSRENIFQDEDYFKDNESSHSGMSNLSKRPRELKPAKIKVDVRMLRQNSSKRQSIRVLLQGQSSSKELNLQKIGHGLSSLNSSIAFPKDVGNDQSPIKKLIRKSSSNDISVIDDIPKKVQFPNNPLISIPEKRIQTQKPQKRLQQQKSQIQSPNKLLSPTKGHLSPEIVIDLNQKENIFNQDIRVVQQYDIRDKEKQKKKKIRPNKKDLNLTVDYQLNRDQSTNKFQQQTRVQTIMDRYKRQQGTLTNQNKNTIISQDFKIRNMSAEKQLRSKLFNNKLAQKIKIKIQSESEEDENQEESSSAERKRIFAKCFPTALMRKTYNSNVNGSLTEKKQNGDYPKGNAYLKEHIQQNGQMRKSFRDEEITYREKMNIVINQNNYTTDLRKKFQDLSQNFDEAKVMSEASKNVLNESLMNGFYNQLSFLDKLGVSQTKKQIQSKELSQLLHDTSHMNSMISAIKFKRFKEEMVERKQSLAFKLSKIYCVKKHSKNVYEYLTKGPNKNKNEGFLEDADREKFNLNRSSIQQSMNQ